MDQFSPMAGLLATGCCIADLQLADQCVARGGLDALAAEPVVRVATSAVATAAMTAVGRILISLSW
jgi:hypothetical protein